jgi:hypothetical protein
MQKEGCSVTRFEYLSKYQIIHVGTWQELLSHFCLILHIYIRHRMHEIEWKYSAPTNTIQISCVRSMFWNSEPRSHCLMYCCAPLGSMTILTPGGTSVDSSYHVVRSYLPRGTHNSISQTTTRLNIIKQQLHEYTRLAHTTLDYTLCMSLLKFTTPRRITILGTNQFSYSLTIIEPGSIL